MIVASTVALDVLVYELPSGESAKQRALEVYDPCLTCCTISLHYHYSNPIAERIMSRCPKNLKIVLFDNCVIFAA